MLHRNSQYLLHWLVVFTFQIKYSAVPNGFGWCYNQSTDYGSKYDWNLVRDTLDADKVKQFERVLQQFLDSQDQVNEPFERQGQVNRRQIAEGDIARF